MANVTIWIEGEGLGDALTNLFGADEYQTANNQWQSKYSSEVHDTAINHLLSLVNKGFHVEWKVETEDGEWAGNAEPLSVYEEEGGTYSDAGNGGENVNRNDFDVAINVIFNIANDPDVYCLDWSEGVKNLLGNRTFWYDSVVNNYYLRYKEDQQ